MAEYTPTTDDVKAALADWMWAQRTWRPELGQPDDAELDRWLAVHDAALEVAVRADMAPRVVSTVEELDALPERSVIHARYPLRQERGEPAQKNPNGTWQRLSPFIEFLPSEIPLPATVLWVPVTPGGNSNG